MSKVSKKLRITMRIYKLKEFLLRRNNDVLEIGKLIGMMLLSPITLFLLGVSYILDKTILAKVKLTKDEIASLEYYKQHKQWPT